MDKLPQRDDLIYKEIEEFEDYELTNCVAYEMAIRIQELRELLNFVILKKILNDIDKKVWQEKSNLLAVKYHLDVKNVTIYYREKLRKIKNINFNKEKFIFAGELTGKDFINSNCMMSIIYTQVNPNNNSFRSRLVNQFSRPEIILLPSQKFPKFDLNLNLPKEELIAYISKIKDDFDKDNSIIKTPLELLGETLEKSDNKKIPKKPKASVYADWFYIYDYWKYEKTQGKTDKDIFVALEVENNVPYKEDMIRKIRDKMKYFIDDLGYKELITGVKNS